MKISKKHDPEFMAQLLNCVIVDEENGTFSSPQRYMSVAVNICWRGNIISIPMSHLMWLMKHKRWPKEGMVIDHINDDPMDNRFENLREITQTENQAKKHNRKVNANFGTGKYGYGISVTLDKRDGRYYVCRQPSRGMHSRRKTVKQSFGGYDTLEKAERCVSLIKEDLIPTMVEVPNHLEDLFEGF